jgi:hypothetical protein
MRCYRCKKTIHTYFNDKQKKIFAKLCYKCYKIVDKNIDRESENYRLINGYVIECLNCGQQFVRRGDAIKHRRYFCDAR